MGNERYVNYKWVEDGLFELSERYGEQALRLIQNAEKEGREAIGEAIIDIVLDHTRKIEELMQSPVPTKVSGALKFERPDKNEISKVYLLSVAPLTDKFRERVIELLRGKPINERMDNSPLMTGGVLMCIRDMKERVEKFLTESEEEKYEEVDYTVFSEEEQEFLNSSYTKQMFYDRYIQPLKMKAVIAPVMRNKKIKKFQDIGDLLGLDVNVLRLLNRKKVPEDPKLRAAYIKIWNWMYEALREIAEQDKISVRLENAVRNYL